MADCTTNNIQYENVMPLGVTIDKSQAENEPTAHHKIHLHHIVHVQVVRHFGRQGAYIQPVDVQPFPYLLKTGIHARPSFPRPIDRSRTFSTTYKMRSLQPERVAFAGHLQEPFLYRLPGAVWTQTITPISTGFALGATHNSGKCK